MTVKMKNTVTLMHGSGLMATVRADNVLERDAADDVGRMPSQLFARLPCRLALV